MKYLKKYKTFIFILLIMGLLTLLFVRATSTSQVEEISPFLFFEEAGTGKIEVLVYDETKSISYGKYVEDHKEGGRFKVGLPSNDPDLQKLIKGNENFRFIKSSGTPWWSYLVNILPFLLLVGVFVFFFWISLKQSGFGLGKSKTKIFTPKTVKTTFNDVAGVDEAKKELQEVVEFLQYPERFNKLGAKMPKGVLLTGPSGTGKTLLARAVAGEAGVPFFSNSGSEFVEMFVGRGAARVRDLFDEAEKNAPCIVFIDEIDAVGRQRGSGLGHSHDEREQTLNQILVEMDGFEPNKAMVIIAATNRPDILDPALLRPGRFDRQVVVDMPDAKGRKAILDIYAKGKPLAPNVKLEELAKETAGFSGADLENLLNEAAILAARENKNIIDQKDLEEAIDRVTVGLAKKSKVISPKEKRISAYHEAGHAIVGRVLPNVDPIHKISIIARGRMGGFTRFLPEDDRNLWTKSQLRELLAVNLGGRIAEEEKLDDVSTGAGNDLKEVRKIAREMITHYAMDPNLPPQAYGETQEMIFLGKEIHEQRDYSEKRAQEIDAAIDALVTWAYNMAKNILMKYEIKLDELADRLQNAETLEGEDLERFFSSIPKEQPSKSRQ